jgi:lipopolysaccharide export system protein LptA
MNKLNLAAALFTMLGLYSLPLAAQDKPESSGKAAVNETTVNSNTFRLDMTKKEGTFSGSVTVKDPKFDLDSDELVVYFNKDNQMERLVARGNVKIRQSQGNSSSSREAEYILTDKKIKLTGDPVVMQAGNRVTGTVITIYPDSDRMDVDGRSKVQFLLK